MAEDDHQDQVQMATVQDQEVTAALDEDAETIQEVLVIIEETPLAVIPLEEDLHQ
jgi:hypothetical protein